MADSPLDPSELDAIRAVLREAGSGSDRGDDIGDEEIYPLAVIAEDRAVEVARPAGLQIAERWATRIARRMRHLARIRVDIAGAEALGGPMLKSQLGKEWFAQVQPGGRSGTVLVSIGGSMIELLAATLLGADLEQEAEDGVGSLDPSATAIEVFRPVGEAITSALVDAWSERQGCLATFSTDAGEVGKARELLTNADVVLAITIELSGTVRGRIRMFAKPTVFTDPPRAIEAVPATPGAIDEALGDVPVDICIELGRTPITMAALAELRVGEIVPLGRFVDDPLPIECAGVVKAHGKAVVFRGVLGVEVQSKPHNAQESKAA